MEIDYNKIDNIEFDGVDHSDYPDYCDVFITSADYDGVEMTDEMLDTVKDNFDFVYEEFMKQLY